jgi:hypothetical protein
VRVCPDEPTIGLYIRREKPLPLRSHLAEPDELFHRSVVMFDGELYSVPTEQMEVISEEDKA